jgi:hypothetical protein
MPDTRDINKAVARQLMSAWNQRGETYIPPDLAHPQLIRHFAAPVGLASATGQANPDAALPKSAVAGQQFTEELMVADEQYAFIAWQMTGQHRGALYGRAATNTTVTVHGSDLIRVVDGKVIEHWDWYSKARVQALAQAGLLDSTMQRTLVQNNLLGRNRRLP